ncbi:MAG: hypothetical protein ISR96_05675 [Nitrospira sp.]|nr:hypothetical protein [bacterium]MBL7048988.1 hypothetical protein [Nitrospira sp.]
MHSTDLDTFGSIKKSCIDIIEYGRKHNITSEEILNLMLKGEWQIKYRVTKNGKPLPGTLAMDEVLTLAQKAIQHACFEGACIILPSGKVIKGQ